ncbi:MAG TPA: YidB family protein [Methylomirabilota bacterium]|nr:YidB family protein [Methylomirabilota bacterium]
MDDLSKLSTSLETGGGSSAADPAVVAGLPAAIQQAGGLDTIVGKLRQGGLDNEVDSWISTGPNDPVDPQRLGSALGPDTVQQLSSGTGINAGTLLPILAMFLPQIIDMLTKHGSTPSGGLDQAAQQSMPDLGGLLGGLLGGAFGGAGNAGTPGSAGTSGTAGTTSTADIDDLLRGLGGNKQR